MIEYPRLICPLPDPLGLYIRPGFNDHTVLLQLLAEDRLNITGVVFDASHHKRHAELRQEIPKHNIHAILDPCTMELATVGG